MKTTSIKVLVGILCLFINSNVIAQSNIYADYHESWNYSTFINLAGSGGGGSVYAEIKDDILTIVFSASFGQSTLHCGKVVELKTNPILPDTDFGYLVSNYSIHIEKGWLTIKNSSLSYDFVTSFSRRIEYNLRNHLTSHVKTYTPVFALGQNIFDPSIPQNLREKTQEDISFFDGLGRPIQQIQIAADATFTKDIVSFNRYDGFGRQSKQYLPFTSDNSKAGHFYSNSKSLQESFYDREYGFGEGSFAFTDNHFNNVINNQVIESRNPGEDWNQNGAIRSNEFNIRLNNPNELEKLEYDPINGQIVYNGYYGAGNLKVKLSKDENSGSFRSEVLEYYDRNEKLICQRNKYLGQYISTYYLYDGKERLKFVIQPEGFARAINNWALYNDQNFKDKWIFEYVYDKYDRVVEKKVPGKDPDHFVYDPYDRIVMMQSGNQRQVGNWTTYSFDRQGRMAMQGVKNFNLSRPLVQNSFDNAVQIGGAQIFETESSDNTGYTKNSYQSSNSSIDWIHYYDHYDFDRNGTIDYQYITDPEGIIPLPAGLKNSPFSLLTGEVYFNMSNIQEKRWKVTFYNEHNLVIQEQYQYHINGIPYTDLKYFEYDFQGNPKRTKTIHKYQNQYQLILAKRYNYDYRGRLKSIFCRVNNDPEVLLVKNEYNSRNELCRKSLHSLNGQDFIQDIDYRYNIRGWLTNINNIDFSHENASTNQSHHRYSPPEYNTDLFAMEIEYVLDGRFDISTSSQYNGNISEVKWQSDSDEKVRGYGFDYSNNGMLRRADFKAYNLDAEDWLDEIDWFSVPDISYDKNGNINILKRMGKDLDRKGNHIGYIDDLVYQNSGNQITGVDDMAAFHGVNDFRDHGMSFQNSLEFEYDPNGNLKYDHAKLMSYDYDRNNMMTYVDLGNHANIQYSYGSDGVKWNKTFTYNFSESRSSSHNIPPRITTYINEFQYVDGVLDFIHHEEGRIVYTGSSPQFRYEYEYRDHLGNVRMRFTDLDYDGIARKGEILQENHYYPFGMEIKGLQSAVNGPEHHVKYNSKEYNLEGVDSNGDKELDHYVNHYDYGARLYDVSLSRWMQVDPMAAERNWLTPYNYVSNNPINRIDPTGALDDWVENEEGVVYWDENALSQNTTKIGETYLGKNVLVGTHNRDASGNEEINTAQFDLYLDSDKTGPSATIMGNTVPADIEKYGTLKEGLYSARFQSRSSYSAKGIEDLSLIINEGRAVPTTSNSPKSSMTEVFFHMGNNYQTSLFDSRGNAYSKGCQTSGCYPGSRKEHINFMKSVGIDFNGAYYLRSNPSSNLPSIIPFTSEISVKD